MGRAPCCDKSNVKRGPWSPDEDATLKNYLEKHGTGGNWIALPKKAAAQLPGRTDNDVKNHWNTKLKKKFLAGNTSSTAATTSNNNVTFSNTSYSDQVKTLVLDHQKLNSADNWFDYSYNVLELEQTPIPVPFPMSQELEAFNYTAGSISCSAPPPSKEVSMLSNADNHTLWFGYDHASEDDPNLLEFVLDDDLLNHGFVSQDKSCSQRGD
ncbi:Transcription factor RAX2 [Glycine soja]